jgi:hypothetical protein
VTRVLGSEVGRGDCDLSNWDAEGWRALTGEEAVQLDEQLEVDIVALGRFAVPLTYVVLVKIDTCSGVRKSVCVVWFMLAAQSSTLEMRPHVRSKVP